MTPEELQKIITEVVEQNTLIPWWVYLLFVILSFLGSYLGSYIKKKSENHATKEDIHGITEKIETVRSGYAKVLEELRSDNQLKLAEIEREKSIKKEVYLEGVEALTRTQNVIARLANLELNDEQINSVMLTDSGIIAKIQIVGSETTVKAVTTIMASIGTAIMELMLERSILISRKNSIEFLEKYRIKAQDEIERYLSIMKNINLEGNQDQRLWDAINKNIEFETQQRDKYAQDIDVLSKTQEKEHLGFTQKCMDKFFETTSLLPDAVLSIRDELNLEISNEAYLDIFNKNTEQGKRVFGEFFEKISNKPA